MFSKIYKVLLRCPAVIVMMISWYLSSQSRVPMPDFKDSDKFVHFICFGGLASCWTLWFSLESWKNKLFMNAALCVAFTSIYGCIDEFHQSFTPGRSCSIFDWIADTTGAMMGVIFCICIIKTIRRSKLWKEEKKS